MHIHIVHKHLVDHVRFMFIKGTSTPGNWNWNWNVYTSVEASSSVPWRWRGHLAHGSGGVLGLLLQAAAGVCGTAVQAGKRGSSRYGSSECGSNYGSDYGSSFSYTSWHYHSVRPCPVGDSGAVQHGGAINILFKKSCHLKNHIKIKSYYFLHYQWS